MRDYFGNLPIVSSMGFMRGIMVLDDCEGTMTWIVTGTGGDDVHAYETAAAWQGEKGLHLKTRTTATAQDDWVHLQKIFDHPASGLLVARLRLCTPDAAKTKSIIVTLRDDDGSQQYAAAIMLAPATNKIYYLNSAGAYVELTAIPQTFANYNWYTLELAADCRTHKYLHVRFNGLSADLSAQAMYNDAATSGRSAQLRLLVTAAVTGPGEAYMDNIYVGEYLEA